MNDLSTVRPIGPDLLSHIRDTPVTGTPAQMRSAFARLAGPQPALRMVELGGVRCAVAGLGAPAALWLHGGGYVFGGPESHGHTITHFAERLGAAVVMPCYRRAPEATWPAPLEDVMAVLDAMAQPVAVVGDSAGGHLALHLAFNRPGRITGLALIGANADRAGPSPSRRANSPHDPMNDDEQDTALARLALPDAACDSIDASPLLGPLDRLPPTYITCARNEVLADDSLRLAHAAALAGIEVELRVEGDLMHLWTLWPHILPAAARTLGRIADEMRAPV